MTDRFVIELAGEGGLVAQLNRAITELERPAALMRDVAGVLEQNVNLRFTTKRDPNGQPWPQISELTPLIYASVNKTLTYDADDQPIVPKMPGTLLERTRRMLNSLAGRAGDSWVEVGFGVPYAIYHETGTERNDKPYMPRRGMLTGDPEAGTLGAEDRQDVQDEIDAHLGRLLGLS